MSSRIYSRNCPLVAQLSPTTVVGIAEMPSTTPKPAKVEPPTKPAPISIQHEPRTSTKDPSVHQAVYYGPSKIPQSIVSRVVAPEASQTPSTAQPPCLQNLPVEILQIILSHVPDIGSLDSAARSCPSVRAAFTNRESELVTAVLGRQIGADLIYDAQFTEACGKNDYWWPREVSELFRQYFARDLRPVRHLRSSDLKLSQAKRLSEAHQLIDYFCDKFGSEVLSPLPQFPRRLAGLPTRQLSISERLRISRTLYRFQTYSNLFKHWEYDVESEFMSQAKTYFHHFAPWENEQLATIHDFLAHIIKQVFQDVTNHSTECINFYGPLDVGVEDSVQYHMSLGLAHIKRFAEADTIEPRFKLLLPTKESLDVRDEFLEDALDSCNAPRKRSILRDLVANGEENEFVSRPFYAEVDRGPIEIWYWAHQQATPESFVFNPAMANLRKCGYVMWDSSRLDEWGVLSESLDYRPNDGQVQRYALEQKYLDERRSWKKRYRALHEKLTKMAVAKQVLPKMRYTGKKFLAARRMVRSSKAWAVRLGVEMDMPPGSFDIPLEETRRSHY